MNNNDIPVLEKYTLTIEEASKYFRIGENKLRRLAEENKDAGWLITVSYTHLFKGKRYCDNYWRGGIYCTVTYLSRP